MATPTGRALLHDPVKFQTEVMDVIGLVVGKCLRLFPHEEPEELAQYAALHVWKRRRDYRTKHSAWKTWVTMVATRRLLDLARSRMRGGKQLVEYGRYLQAAGRMPEIDAQNEVA